MIAYSISVGESEERGQPASPRHREDNIKFYLTEIRQNDIGSTYLAQDRGQ
jgi:hypothetical protein